MLSIKKLISLGRVVIKMMTQDVPICVNITTKIRKNMLHTAMNSRQDIRCITENISRQKKEMEANDNLHLWIRQLCNESYEKNSTLLA